MADRPGRDGYGRDECSMQLAARFRRTRWKWARNVSWRVIE